MNELQRKVQAMFPNAKQAFRLRNPEIFGATVGSMQGAQREQNVAPALGRKVSRKGKRSERVVQRREASILYRVILVAFQQRLQDSDNTIAGLKDLRDVISTWLRVDDSDKLIDWNYGQVQTRGEEGVAVRIEKL